MPAIIWAWTWSRNSPNDLRYGMYYAVRSLQLEQACRDLILRLGRFGDVCYPSLEIGGCDSQHRRHPVTLSSPLLAAQHQFASFPAARGPSSSQSLFNLF